MRVSQCACVHMLYLAELRLGFAEEGDQRVLAPWLARLLRLLCNEDGLSLGELGLEHSQEKLELQTRSKTHTDTGLQLTT